MKKKLISLLLILTLSNILMITASANNTKVVALTFDDGPSFKYTPTLLDALRERGVHVTFFLVGYTLEVNKDIARQAWEDGHQLANHSFNHPWFSRMSQQGIQKELSSVDDILAEITGESNFMIRIPYGDICSTVRNMKYAPMIQWSVDPGNGNMSTSQANMLKNLLKNVTDGSIVILHDTNSKNVNVAIDAIDALLEQGYEFVTLDELFRLKGITPENGQTYYSVPNTYETAFDESRLNEHWACDYIQAVKNAGIMQGDGEGFKPNGYMTRGMAAVILNRLSGEALTVSSAGSGEDLTDLELQQTFADVAHGTWYYNAVEWAAKKGYINGVGDGLFAPDSFITKEEFYTLLTRYASAELQAAQKTDFPVCYRDDVRISGWASEGIQLLRSTGFKSENDPEIFRPKDFISRAEAAELVEYIMRYKAPAPAPSPNEESTGGSEWALRCFLVGDSLLLNAYLFVNRNKVDSTNNDLNN